MNGDDRRSRRGFVDVGTLQERGPAAPKLPPPQRSVSGAREGGRGGTVQPEARSRSTRDPTSAAQREQGARKGPLQGEASGRLAKSASGGGGECRRSGPRVDRGSCHARWDGTRVTNRQPFRGRRPGASRDQQAAEVAKVGVLDRAVFGGRPAVTLRAAALAAVLLGGCKPEEVNADPEAPAADPTVALLSVIGFEPIVDGMSRGFNLDDAVTASVSDPGCGRADLVAPDGTPGVDNAFGALLPLITSLGGEALQSLVQNAVLSGELLLLFELDDLEGTPTDSCTSGRVVRGLGQPFLGTDGAILPGQTFDVNELFPSAELSCVRPQADGSVIADGVVLRLPLQVFDEHIDLTLIDGRIQLQPTEGGWTGVIGGGVSIDELAENVFGLDAIPTELEDGVVQAVRLTADLAEDAGGVCQQLSVTLAVDAVPAYLFEDAP
jgi:hypothetical protein